MFVGKFSLPSTCSCSLDLSKKMPQGAAHTVIETRERKRHLGPALQVVRLAHFDEGAYGVAQALLPEVVPEDAGGAGVRHDVGVALVQVLGGEGPVIEGGACVVVLYEAHRARGPHAQQPRGAPLAVHKAPVLSAAHGFLQDACVRASLQGANLSS